MFAGGSAALKFERDSWKRYITTIRLRGPQFTKFGGRLIKISPEEASTTFSPLLSFLMPRIPSGVQRESSAPQFTYGTYATRGRYIQIHTDVHTRRLYLYVPWGIIASPGVDLCHQSWSPDVIPWSMACLFSAYTLRRNQVLCALAKPRLLRSSSRVRDTE